MTWSACDRIASIGEGGEGEARLETGVIAVIGLSGYSKL